MGGPGGGRVRVPSPTTINTDDEKSAGEILMRVKNVYLQTLVSSER